MKITKELSSATHAKLLISATTQDLEPIRNHVISHFKSRVKVPGFRTGTAPASLVEKHIDQKLLLDEFLEHALNHFYSQAITEEAIRPASRPNMQLKKFVPYSELEFSAELDIIGKISLPDYMNLKVAKKAATVTVADVDVVLKNLIQRAAKRESVNRPAKTGDEIIIDFKGTDKAGKLVSGAEAKDYPLLLGSGNFIPGFEEKLIGLAPGESKRFSIKFPSDYSVKNMQNQDVNFEIKAKKVQTLAEPKLDDKFAATLGPFKSVVELKADVKRQLSHEKQQQAEREYENEVVKKIVDKAKVEIPQSLIDEDIERGEEDEKRNLIAKGQTWKEHLEAEGITEEEHKKKQRPDAQNRVKIGLVLSEIVERENVEVTPEEIDLRVQLLKSQYQDEAMRSELDKPQNRREIEARLITEKTVVRLVNYSSHSSN